MQRRFCGALHHADENGASSGDAAGRWTYVLDNNLPAVQALKAGETRVDTITVRVTDSAGGWDDQVVTITVTGTNDAPVAADDSGTTPEGWRGVCGQSSGQ